MQKLTIKEIARMAGVSTTVVSFVINNKPGVNENTRRRVMDVLEKTGFQPSLTSRRMIYKKSFNISVVRRRDSSPFNNLFYYEIAQGLVEKSENYGYNIIFTNSPEADGRSGLPEIIRQKDTDGVIFLQDAETGLLNELESRGIPFVVVDSHNDDGQILSVRADYQTAARTATAHLVENGHRSVAFISSSFVPNFYKRVFAGFREALNARNLPIPSGWIQMDAEDEESAWRAMDAILSQKEKPTAVFCATDHLAIGAMNCATERGYAVPGDLSFVGIDDILLSHYVKPGLTTVRIDKFEMGSMAFEMLMRKINGEAVESRTVQSDNLIVRGSVAARA